jgi:hypothetical protein
MKTYFYLLILLFSVSSFAQVGIGTTTPDASSILDIESTTTGVLIPRMTEAQKTLIGSPATGLLIYQTDATSGFWFFDGSLWTNLSAGVVSGEFQSIGGIVQNTSNPGADDFVFGASSLSGADTKFFFDKSKGAFRAGEATGSEWNDSNVGTGSVALGTGALVSGDYAIGLGTATASGNNAFSVFGDASGVNSFAANGQAFGDFSVAMIGGTTDAAAEGAIAMGDTSQASGTDSIAIGQNAQAIGNDAVAIGLNSNAGGNAAVAMAGASVTGVNAFGFGTAVASGNNGFSVFGDATGVNSFAVNGQAYGDFSVATNGGTTDAAAEGAIAMGDTSQASGTDSVAIGQNAQAIGNDAMAFGFGSSAGGNASVAMAGASVTGVNAFGFGTAVASGNNGFSVFGDASGVNSFAANGQAFGDFSVAMNGGTTDTAAEGAIAMGDTSHASGTDSVAIGQNAVASGNDAVALGFGSSAGGTTSAAMAGASVTGNSSFGFGAATANGNNSFSAFGTADGANSFAVNGVASGLNSMALQGGAASNEGAIALGDSASASGQYSVAIGSDITAYSFGETVVGYDSASYTPASTTTAVATDRLFVVANNTSENAFNVLKNGRTGIARLPATNMLEVNGNASKSAAGDWLANSDRRLKKNIETFSEENALNTLKKLRGVTYQWDDKVTGNERPQGVQYGFIAQEIMEVFPENVEMDNTGYYQTAYGTYDALYVQAIKALSNKVEILESENAALRDQIKEIHKMLQSLELSSANNN